ncbi:hypothetical protein ACJX0J_037482, partial [Zea mays]
HRWRSNLTRTLCERSSSSPRTPSSRRPRGSSRKATKSLIMQRSREAYRWFIPRTCPSKRTTPRISNLAGQRQAKEWQQQELRTKYNNMEPDAVDFFGECMNSPRNGHTLLANEIY